MEMIDFLAVQGIHFGIPVISEYKIPLPQGNHKILNNRYGNRRIPLLETGKSVPYGSSPANSETVLCRICFLGSLFRLSL